MENRSMDFGGTDLIFLNLKKELLPEEIKYCHKCGNRIFSTYWKFGMVNVVQRSHEICEDCYNKLNK